MFILFVVKYDSAEEINMEEMMGGGMSQEKMKEIYSNPIYKKALLAWLPFLNKRGFLDTLLIDEPAPVEAKKEEASADS